MTANGYTPSYFDLKERTFLPQLPKNVKNENMERSRQFIRTTNEEYGKYWNGFTQSTALPPTYLTDPTPEAIAATSRWYRRYRPDDDWSYSGQSHRSPDFRYVLDHRRNGSHRNHYDLVENAGMTSSGVAWTDRPDWYLNNRGSAALGNSQLSTYRNGPSSLWPITSQDRVRRNRYKVAIGDRLVSGKGSDWTLSDIKSVDLNVHLNDNTVVTVPDIPFYYD